jgi:hypothetical protein
MKSISPFAIIVVVGIAAFVLAESPSANDSRSEPADVTEDVTRYEMHGEGEERMMLDRKTGQTWELRTVLSAPTSADPKPIVVWFPIPRADDKLSQSILQARISQLNHFADSEFEEAKRHITELEKELGADDPSVVIHKEELKIYSEARGIAHEKPLLDLFND